MRGTTIGKWQVTRTTGECLVFEGETEREARLLAREAFPDDARFGVELISRVCERCRATVAAGARCESCKAMREARKRLYVVRASFLVKAGWTPMCEVRVRAFGLVGASALGVREAKKATVKRGARITQTKIEVLHVRKQAGR